MSVDFLQATSTFLEELVRTIGTGSFAPGVAGLFGSLAEVVSTS